MSHKAINEMILHDLGLPNTQFGQLSNLHEDPPVPAQIPYNHSDHRLLRDVLFIPEFFTIDDITEDGHYKYNSTQTSHTPFYTMDGR